MYKNFHEQISVLLYLTKKLLKNYEIRKMMQILFNADAIFRGFSFPV